MFFITPEWTAGNSALYIFLAGLALAVGPVIYKMEAASRQFIRTRTLPPRAAMLILYGLPILVALGMAAPLLTTLRPVQTILLIAILAHFTKRCLEALFIHKYSTPAALATTLPIAAFYSTVAGVGVYLSLTSFPPADMLFALGVLLFSVGEIGNFIHHKILADLRKDSLAYVIPRGGLFEYVACPHYLFEIIAWLGIALLSRHVFMFIALIGMIGFLTARALLTLTWYRTEFPEFPKARKALIPFIF